MSRAPALLPPPRQDRLGRARFASPSPAGVATVIEAGHRPEGYRLRVDGSGVRLAASDQAGLARGRATLAQLDDGAEVAEADITDWPDLPVRGLMLDISRDKVPTMDTLHWLVDRMAAWKLNHLQLYTEHTYAYPGHDDVWRDASPMTAEEVAELGAYCAARHVELSANQNCLGHMERWLAHDRYRPLAVTPNGWPDHRGHLRHPTTMEPAHPGSLALARELLAELVPRFASDRVHVGLDEPWELPPERAPDYAAYVRRLRAAPELDGREMLMWGDIVALHPELAPLLPEGVTVCEWGYEADHPFDDRSRALAAAGRPFWVCPGTSSWDSLIGRWTNARENCSSAARAGVAHGASGYLVTDWGDNGHLQPLSVSLPGLAAGAAAAWNAAEGSGADFPAALADALVDRTAGGDTGRDAAAALLELGDAHRVTETQSPNMVSVLIHFWYPQLRVGRGFTADLDHTQLDAYEEVLDRARPRIAERVGDRPRPAGPVGPELDVAVEVARLAVADAGARLDGDGSLRSIPAGRRTQLAERAETLAEGHRELWTVRNRPGGRDDSADRLRHLAACHRQGQATEFVPAWHGPVGP